MLQNNAMQNGLQSQFNNVFKPKNTPSLEDKYYTLACDIQDVAIAMQRGMAYYNIRELEDKVYRSRDAIRSMSKR